MLTEIYKKNEKISHLMKYLDEDLIDEETGEIIEKTDIENVIAELNKEIQLQLVNEGAEIVKANVCMASDIKTVDDEISRLLEIKDKMIKNKKRFENFLMENMMKLDKKKIETPVGNIVISDSVVTEIYDKNLIPDTFKKKIVVETEKISKNELKKMLKAGSTIPGVRLKINHNIKIK